MKALYEQLYKELTSEFAQFVMVPILIMIALICFVNGMFAYDDLTKFFLSYFQGFVACGIAILLLLYQRQEGV